MNSYDIENHMILGDNEAFYGKDGDPEFVANCDVCGCEIWDDMEYDFALGEFICEECGREKES